MVVKLNGAFSLEVQVGATGKEMRQLFLDAGGAVVVQELLEEAGLAHGHWVFRLIKRFTASGHTPSRSVRHAESHGVILNIKPGDNGTAMRGTLVVSREHKMTAEQVRLALLAVTASQVGEKNAVDHVSLALTRDQVRSFLECVQQCPVQADISGFVGVLQKKFFSQESVSHVLEVLEYLVDEEYLVDRRTHYELTPSGKEFLPAPDLLADLHTIQEQLLVMEKSLLSCRARQEDLRKERVRLQEEILVVDQLLEEEIDREKDLIGVDLSSVARLLNSVKDKA